MFRHERKPEEDFRNVRSKQLRCEQQIHAIVSEWETKRINQLEMPSNEELLAFLQSIQDALYYPSGRDPDYDDFDDDDEADEENLLYLMPDDAAL